MPEFGIVAALEREISPFVQGWEVTEREHEGKRFKFYLQNETVLVCGGIGAGPARRATEALIALYHPTIVQSVGYAGALDPALKAGMILQPKRVIDATDGSSRELDEGTGVLVTAQTIADVAQKRNLASSYAAAAVDMEAAAVAKGAEARGVAFGALKVISDGADFAIPGSDRFVTSDGRFQAARFMIFAAIRPWLWPRILRLASNSARATKALSQELGRQHRLRTSGMRVSSHTA